MPTPPNLIATARRVLAAMTAAEGVGNLATHAPDADTCALVAHLATLCPGLILTLDGEGRTMHTAAIVAPTGVTFDLYRVAPPCFVSAHERDWQADRAAYHALVQIAEDTVGPTAEAIARHQPHPAIPVDDEPGRAA